MGGRPLPPRRGRTTVGIGDPIRPRRAGSPGHPRRRTRRPNLPAGAAVRGDHPQGRRLRTAVAHTDRSGPGGGAGRSGGGDPVRGPLAGCLVVRVSTRSGGDRRGAGAGAAAGRRSSVGAAHRRQGLFPHPAALYGVADAHRAAARHLPRRAAGRPDRTPDQHTARDPGGSRRTAGHLAVAADGESGPQPDRRVPT